MKIISDHINYRIYYIAEQVIFNQWLDNAYIDVDKATEISDAVQKLTKGKRAICIANLGTNTGSMTNDAKAFIANDESLNNFKIFEILLTKSRLMKFLAKAYLFINKPKAKTYIANNLVEIIDILNSHSVDNHVINEVIDCINQEIEMND